MSNHLVKGGIKMPSQDQKKSQNNKYQFNRRRV